MKRWSHGGILLIGILALVGCHNQSNELPKQEDEQEIITLNVLHQFNDLGTELHNIYNNAVTEYEKQNPHIKIETEIVNMDAYKTKIQIEFASDAQNIDVFYYWAESKPYQLALADKILPLDDYLTEDILANIKPEALDSFTYNEKIYAVPTFGWYLAFYCNQELFKLADAKIPETFDELVLAVEKLNQLEGVIPIVVGGRDGWDASLIYQALALGELGATHLNGHLRGEAAFSEDDFIEAAKNLKQLSQMHAFGETPFAFSNAEANTFFTQGSGGMRFMGSWYANQVQYQKGNRDIIATQIPINHPSFKTDYVGGYVESFFVNKNTKHKEEAAKFAIYISEVIGNGAHRTGLGPSGWKSSEEPDYLNPIANQIYEMFAQSEQNVIAWDTLLPPRLGSLHMEHVQTLLTSEGDPETFTKAHVEMLNNYYKK